MLLGHDDHTHGVGVAGTRAPAGQHDDHVSLLEEASGLAWAHGQQETLGHSLGLTMYSEMCVNCASRDTKTGSRFTHQVCVISHFKRFQNLPRMTSQVGVSTQMYAGKIRLPASRCVLDLSSTHLGGCSHL